MTARQLLKRLGRPVTSRVYARIDRRIRDETTPRLEEFQGEVAALGQRLPDIEDHRRHVSTLEERVNALEQYVPTLLNTISSQNASARAHTRALDEQSRHIAELSARLDRAIPRSQLTGKGRSAASRGTEAAESADGGQ